MILQVVQDLTAVGYQVSWNILNAADYGVPQNRKRVFLIGLRRDGTILRKNGRIEYHIGCMPGAMTFPKWYFAEGWLSVKPDGFVKDKNGKNTKRQRWSWAVTTKYIADRIDIMELALDELMNRREYKKQEELKAQEELIKSMPV